MVYCFCGQELPQSFIQDELAFYGYMKHMKHKHKKTKKWSAGLQEMPNGVNITFLIHA